MFLKQEGTNQIILKEQKSGEGKHSFCKCILHIFAFLYKLKFFVHFLAD